MTPQIRDGGPSDTVQAYSLIRASLPCLILTEQHMRWRLAHPMPGTQDTRLVAVVGDTVVGHLLSRLRTHEDGTRTGRSYLGALAESHRTAELAEQLLAASEASLIEKGANILRANSAQEGVQTGGGCFHQAARKRGYEVEEEHHVLGLDLSGLPNRPETPEGFELRRMSDFDDPRPLYELDKACDEDEPGESDEFAPYEFWLNSIWENPLIDLDISLVMTHEGVPVSFSAYMSDQDTRVGSAMTGTQREYRGRGLAKCAKISALHRARGRGLRHAYTENHVSNQPMLAINDRLGYEAVGVERFHVRRVSA
ncbi:GNAT family N-acetyltransferase [Nocardiopsis prasina]|uniref:GNAT family N-acetyltransferase n=1 Tax=Nocardiopsis prasina TaxID=2015 RepID=UPI00034BB052|nr:GNAT family N-acetyltransferase [Nocardiopsis prasina]